MQLLLHLRLWIHGGSGRGLRLKHDQLNYNWIRLHKLHNVQSDEHKTHLLTFLKSKLSYFPLIGRTNIAIATNMQQMWILIWLVHNMMWWYSGDTKQYRWYSYLKQWHSSTIFKMMVIHVPLLEVKMRIHIHLLYTHNDTTNITKLYIWSCIGCLGVNHAIAFDQIQTCKILLVSLVRICRQRKNQMILEHYKV